MKTTATFRLNKRFKAMISAMPFKDQDQRDSFRHMMIEAQSSVKSVFKGSKERNSNSTQGE